MLLTVLVSIFPNVRLEWLAREILDSNERFAGRIARVATASETFHQAIAVARADGRGIPADKLDSIFERFHQVDASDSREKGGSGLGLAICRTLVRQHGGDIRVESEPGRGSTFTVTVPMSAAPQAAAA